MVAPAQATTIAASSTPNDHKTKYALALQLVVTDLIKAYDAGDTLNFTKLKGNAAKKYKLQGIPKLADILQALPIAYRAKLLPFLQTKPVRSASGVAVVGALCNGEIRFHLLSHFLRV
jgi:elongator complex protein 3